MPNNNYKPYPRQSFKPKQVKEAFQLNFKRN